MSVLKKGDVLLKLVTIFEVCKWHFWRVETKKGPLSCSRGLVTKKKEVRGTAVYYTFGHWQKFGSGPNTRSFFNASEMTKI